MRLEGPNMLAKIMSFLQLAAEKKTFLFYFYCNLHSVQKIMLLEPVCCKTQGSPIWQTRYWAGTFFCCFLQQTSSSTQKYHLFADEYYSKPVNPTIVNLPVAQRMFGFTGFDSIYLQRLFGEHTRVVLLIVTHSIVLKIQKHFLSSNLGYRFMYCSSDQTPNPETKNHYFLFTK